ncbi:MAG: radical SAM protein [Verrucomicrobia bacterium]|nr:radical SAM protein [Verrucomicrobiota bacterium]
MNELFLFVRPPRPLWPFNGPSSAFWPPLAFASMAAMLRECLPDLRVEILDAPALEMGWRTLEGELRRRQPAYVGIGEEAVSCVEGLRLAALAKDCGARVIAGGCFFGHVAPEALRTGLIDVVVHGEGELTIVELVEALRSGRREELRNVAGLSFLLDDEVLSTPPRPPIADLDGLPFPAYDLLPVERYGARSRNHPRFAAIELGRGCVGSCDFCILWRQMGRLVDGRIVPHLRTKSPERLLEEIRILVRRFDRQYLGWVDPCFNAHPRVPGQLAELLLRDGLTVGQSAWVRSDGVVRDAASGALASGVRAGLNELYLGIERPDVESLHALHKTSELGHAHEALRILRNDFPQVITIGSFIYGLPGDDRATIRALHRLAIELRLDQSFFIPFTPLPGTGAWKPELWDPTGRRFRQFSFLSSYRAHDGLSVLERALLVSLLFHWPLARLRTFFPRDARRRRISRRLGLRGGWYHVRQFARSLFAGDNSGGMVFPAWYES